MSGLRRVVGLMLGLHLVPQAIAWACSCAPPASVDDALLDSDLVVFGEVLSVQEPFSFGCTVSSADPMTVRIEVIEGFVGAGAGDVVEVTTARSGASCGVGFVEGETWIVYGLDGRTGLCSRTRGADGDDAELEELRGAAP